MLTSLKPASWASSEQENAELKASVLALAADYFLRAKSADNKPVDPVARFHLGNGARLERINWLGDTSEKGLREAHGLMVNYRYELKEIEKNHEAYANDGPVACSRAVKALLRSPSKTKSFVKTVVHPEPPKALAPPKKSPEEDKIEAPAMPKAE